MKKETIINILTKGNIDIKDLNEFVNDYVLQQKGKEPTAEELTAIVELCKSGFFNLRYAAIQAANFLGLNVMTAVDKNGVLLKTYVYESF